MAKHVGLEGVKIPKRHASERTIKRWAERNVEKHEEAGISFKK